MRARLRAFLFALCVSSALALAAPQAAAESHARRPAGPRRLVSRLLRRRVRERRRRRDTTSRTRAAAASFSPVQRRPRRRSPPPSAAEMLRARHRDLRSDFLLVKSPETQALVPFRDVIDVDGIPVRDREERLAKLFLDATAPTRWRRRERIGEEGARYNLGNMRSTLGNPVLALGVLQQSISRGSVSRSARKTGASARRGSSTTRK